MKTIYPFRTTDAKLAVRPVASLSNATVDRYLRRHPKATHVVISETSYVVYAICGSELDANQAIEKLNKFDTIA